MNIANLEMNIANLEIYIAKFTITFLLRLKIILFGSTILLTTFSIIVNAG